MRHKAWTIMAAGGLTGMVGLRLACDDKNQLPPEIIRAQQQQQQKQSATKTGPTTRDLLNGPKKHLRLAGMPFALDVPSSWDLRSLAEGALITVSGPATSGEINIQL